MVYYISHDSKINLERGIMANFIDKPEDYIHDDDFSNLDDVGFEDYSFLKDSLDNPSKYAYTNRMGIRVPVSEEHIEKAIEFKLELQKSSPSMKCNWNNHKDMMIDSGFGNNTIVDSSDSNESYRQMIKRAQKDRGELPRVESYAEMVSNSKLNTIKKKTGELYREKRALQKERREYNKSKRAITDQIILAEDIVHELKSLNLVDYSEIMRIDSVDLYNSLIEQDEHNKALVLPADWHIGQASRDLKIEDMEYRIAVYVEEIIKYAKRFGIVDLYVSHLGDLINQHLHSNSGFYNELDISEQIIQSFRLIFGFLDELSNHFNVIFLGVINGNHDRLQSDKKSALYQDGVGKLMTMMIDSEIKKINKATLHSQLDGYNVDYIYLDIDGKGVYLEHGDKVNPRNDIGGRMSQINKLIDMRVKGHIHTFKVESYANDRLDVTSGSLNGSDDYAENLGFVNGPSQLIIPIIDNNFIPIDLKLD